MFGSRARSIVTVTVIIEATIAGWVLGRPAEALLLMVLAVTAADTLWGLLRRHALSDLAGVELACVLGLLLAVRADMTMTCLVASCCAAWLVLPERQQPLRRPGESRSGR
ncbi:MAG TPA: hypothetical protein VE824_03525 [Gaiellales bacterium]|nr:hypothetical protein [Gaiellales bacterium]